MTFVHRGRTPVEPAAAFCLVGSLGCGVGEPNPSADLLCQLDDDPFGAVDVAEPVAVLVALQLADELSAAGSQAGDDGVDVFDDESDMADARCVRRRVPVAGLGRRWRSQTGRRRAPRRGPPSGPRPTPHPAARVRVRRRTRLRPRGRQPRCRRGPSFGSSCARWYGIQARAAAPGRKSPDAVFISTTAPVDPSGPLQPRLTWGGAAWGPARAGETRASSERERLHRVGPPVLIRAGTGACQKPRFAVGECDCAIGVGNHGSVAGRGE